MKRFPILLVALALVAADLSAPSRAAEAEPHPSGKLPCLGPAETREQIKARKLVEPYTALKSAQAQYKAEPVSAKLCRHGDDYVYVIALLHRDGRYVHVVMNAATGKWIDMRRSREPPPKS